MTAVTSTGDHGTAAASSGSPALDDALATAVGRAARRGASLDDLWRAAIAAEPDLASAVDRRSRLLTALERLVAAGVVRPLPTRRDAQDRSALPALPLVVRPVAESKSAPAARVALPADLLPELAGAQELDRPRVDEIDTLRAVNDFLRDFDTTRPVVPLRERSLEIFGDEKRLDALVGRRLFTMGILSLELLRCYEVHPPFVYQRVSRAPIALVMENHHTYDSARRVLARDPRGIGVVAYGAGRAFCASVTYLGDLEPGVECAYYFGDLDGPGLSIAQGAAEVARHAGVAPVVASRALYRALLDSPARRPGVVADTEAAASLVAWLPVDLQAEAMTLLMAGEWIPQEAVGLETLEALADWR